MTTDDRDTESQNPSKSFQVGEVDRLSGFFTPVWESKRRLRAESPVPPSSAAASAPSSARVSDKNSRPSMPPPSAPPDAPAAAKAAPSHPARPSRPPPRPSVAQRTAVASNELTSAAEPTQTAGVVPGMVVPEGATPAMSALSTPVPPVATVRRREDLETAQGSTSGAAAPDGLDAPGDVDAPGDLVAHGDLVAPGSNVAPEPHPIDAEARAVSVAPATTPDAFAGTALTTGAAVSVRPVIPMPSTPGRAAARPSKPPSSSPNAAAAARKQTGSSPGPQDVREREPDSRESEAAPLLLRRPARAEMPGAARPGNAGGALHERFERKLPVDSVDTFPRHRETESEREALQAMAARAAATAADPYPSHVLRTLRRTIHLSTTLPEAVRQMIDKYRY